MPNASDTAHRRQSTSQRFHLSRSQAGLRIGGRHPLGLIVASDAMDELARVGFAGNDGRLAGIAALNGRLAQIQPKPAFARLFIGAMAMKAIVRQDWSNIA